MTEQEKYSLSCYKSIACLDDKHKVFLVQHALSNKIYVRKELISYNIDVYKYLMAHPVDNTPRIYELIEDNGKLIIIEEYFNGNTLQEYLDDHGIIPAETARNIIIKLCRIVECLHTADPPIIHRDIKPSNIIITDSFDIKLLDMNAARQLSGVKPHDTELLGTAGYAAPEQFGFSETNERTDIYAIGVLLNVMLTDKLPKEYTPKGHLGKIIKKCTSIDPAKRYANIDALLSALGVIRPSENDHVKAGSFMRFLPPGFRTLHPPYIIAAIISYALIIYLGITFKLDRVMPDKELLLYRICVTFMLLFMVFFSGNYLNIQKKLPLTKSKNVIVRTAGIILGNIIIFLLTILVLGTLIIVLVR